MVSAPIAIHSDVGIGAGTRIVANGARIRGVAGLNASVWIENSAGEVGVDDFDGAGEVWVDAQVCAVCTHGDRIATECTFSENKLALSFHINRTALMQSGKLFDSITFEVNLMESKRRS